MNSRQRLSNVLEGKKSDRVPVTLFIHDFGDFISELYPDIDPWDSLAYDLKIVEVQKQFGLDVFVRSMLFADEGSKNPLAGLDITHQSEAWNMTHEFVKKDDTLTQKTTIETPEGTLSHELSCHEVRKGTFLIACTKKPIEKSSDLELVIKYEPKMPDSWKGWAKERIRKVRDSIGKDGIVGVWLALAFQEGIGVSP